MYLTRNEYITKGGNAVDDTTFNRLERKARTHIPNYVKARIDEENVSDNVKDLMFELINLTNDAELSSGHTSESNDGVSVSLDTSYWSKSAVAERAFDLVHDYLQDETASDGTPLMYCGVK